jgi:hypothetical protein
MAESRTLPHTRIRRAAATIGEDVISNCASEKALLDRSRERWKCQLALLSELLDFPGVLVWAFGRSSSSRSGIRVFEDAALIQ